MARRSPIKVGLALVFISVICNVNADDKCRTGCQGASHNFKYVEGTTYKYNFDSKIDITLSSADGQKSTTEVKAQVLLTQQSECNQILRVQNVQVIGNDGKKHAHIPDIEKSIRLSFQDGRLDDSICIEPGDTQNSLNIKRAIASLFQSTPKSGYETDVFGLCPTEVLQRREGNVLVVTKARVLNKCAYRENIKQDFLSTAFNLDSEIKSSPILQGDLSVTQKIKNGIIESVVATESYLYVPFSVGSNGAKAIVESKVTLAGNSRENPAVKTVQKRSIIFEDPHPIIAPSSNVNSILNAVHNAANTIRVTVTEKTAKEFVNLIRIFRVSKKDDLLAVYNQVRAGVGFSDKAAGKKLFLDALLRAGNGDAVEVAIELLKSKELSPYEQKLVFIGLSLVRHTTEASLNSAATLLNQQNLPREAYLGIGTLIGKHCRQHSCKNVNAVNKLTQALIQKIGDGKAANRNAENDIIFALKALRNANHLNDAILAKLTAIAQDKKAPARLRVAALETYSADACKDKLRDSAMGILKDIQQDSEIRIRAYLAVAQCPNAKAGNAVKNLLEHEPSQQVGGFITSHIRNIRSSVSPDKELAKQHLGFITLPKRFKVDWRKWSFNGGYSSSFETLGVANNIDTNIIYSQNSFLPRSTSLNLTAEVFGHSFNFLEIETRQENLDRLVEHYFGRKGLLRSNSLQELWDNKGKHAKDVLNKLQEKVRDSLRVRRDVTKAEIDQIQRQVQIKTNSLNQDLDVDFSVKAFGSEVFFLNINEDAKKFTPEVIIDKIVSGLNQGLDKLKSFEETLRSNLLFLDAEFAYPTLTGFPLRLAVEGSSAVQIKAAGNIDIRALLNKDSKVKISLIPSANIQVAGLLTLDSLPVESGLKVISTLHTSSGGDLTIEIFGGDKGLDVKFALPLEKQNIVSATHDIVFHQRELGVPEINKPLKFAQNKDFSICLDQLSPVIGLTFCADVNGPNVQGKHVPVLPFPLAGDAKLEITIEKEDVSQYHFRQVAYNEPGKFGGEVIIESLGNNGEKKVSLQLDGFWAPEKRFKATLISPIKTATLEGKITSEDREKSGSIKFVHDNSEYFAKLGASIEGSPSKLVYKPILEYRTPQDSSIKLPPYKVDGQVTVEKSGNDDIINVDLTSTDGTNNIGTKGRIQANRDSLKVNVEVKNSFNPQANIHLKTDLSKQDNELKAFFQIIHGADLSSKTNILTYNGVIRKIGPEGFETKNHFTYPLVNADLTLDVTKANNKIAETLKVAYNQVSFGEDFSLEFDRKPDGIEYDLKAEAHGLNNKIKVNAKRSVKGDDSQIAHLLDINGKTFEVYGKVKHHAGAQDLDIGSDLNVKLANENVPFKIMNALKYDAQDIDLSQKISQGGNVFVDIFLKANRGGNANGAVKVNLRNHLKINGQVKANKGVGNGDVLIELPEAKRSVKVATTFTVHDPTYNVVLEIYPVFAQDKSKKITVSTHTKVQGHNAESRNSIDFLGNVLELNGKGHHQGTFDDLNCNGEVELTLPNGNYLLCKYNHKRKVISDVLNGDIQGAIEYRPNKNQAGHKLSLVGHAKNTNPKQHIFDVDYVFGYENGGQNLFVDLAYQRQPKGNDLELVFKNKVHGSALKNPIETVITGRHSKDRTGSYTAKSTCSPRDVINAKINYDLSGENRPASGGIEVDVQSSSQVLRSIKVSGQSSVLQGESVEVKGTGSIYADAPEGIIIDTNGSGEVKVGDKDGRVKAKVRYGKIDPITVDAGFSRSEAKDASQQVKGDLTVGYGKGQKVTGDVTVVRVNKNEYKIDLQTDLPIDKHKNNKLQVHTKCSDDKQRHTSEITLISDGQKYSLDSDFIFSDVTPSVDIVLKRADGKTSQLTGKITKSSDTELGAELKVIDEPRDFILESAVDASFISVDDFHIKVALHCPSIKLEKIIAEAQNKESKAGRRIQVTAKSANKNILQGSTSYTSREEHGKLIVEGSGSFKVKDETKSANFKYIRQNLSLEKNGESGLEISFDAGLGNKAVDAELKLTNKQFRILNSYCEEKKQCAHVEIDLKTNSDDANHFNQELEITVDLRKLGFSHEFGLKAVTNRKEYILDHTVDVHFQSQENSKYQYSLYLHPKEAGVSLTTPKRVIALQANINVPKNIKEGGKASGEIVLHTDKKNQPNQKSALIGWLNVDPKANTIEGELKFTNPGLRRPLSISGNSRVLGGNKRSVSSTLTIDAFAQPNQKIVVNVQRSFPEVNQDANNYEGSETIEIKSQGLAIDIREEQSLKVDREARSAIYNSALKYRVGNSNYNSQFDYKISPSAVNVFFKVLNHAIVKIDTKLQLSKNSQIIDEEVVVLGRTTYVSHAEIKNLNTLKYTLSRKDKPQDILTVTSGLIPGQIADFRASKVIDGVKLEFVHATVKLDDANFLKTEYGVNSKNIEKFLKNSRSSVEGHVEEFKKITGDLADKSQKEVQQLGELAKKAAPNLTPLKDYYASEIEKLKEEIVSDKTIKDISEFVQNIFAAFSQAFGEIFAHFSTLVESIIRAVAASSEKILQLLEKELLPKIKEIVDKAIHFAGDIFDKTADIILTYLAKASEIAEKYQPELKQLGATISEATQDLVQVVVRAYENIRTILLDQWKDFYNELKALPIFEELQAQYQTFIEGGIPSSEALVATLKDALNTVKDLIPVEEVKALIDTVGNYLELKLTGKPVDDAREFDKMFKAILAVVKRLASIASEGGAPDWEHLKVPLQTNIFNRLPKLVAAKFSPVAYLLKEETPGIPELLLSFVNKPRNWIPPFPLYGLVAQGQHIFTFDGKHVTFPGKCNYVLAHDAQDGNFTVVGSYKDGILISITVSSHGESITLKKGGQVLFNNAQAELPVRKTNVASWRNYERIDLFSPFGVHVICGPQLVVCSVTVSGFYHGKIRGLLGNGNNEQYDDLTLPNGKISTSASDFGNAYKTGQGCAPVKAFEQHDHQETQLPPSCAKLFDWESDLRLCYPFVDVENFKAACAHGIQGGVKDTEKAVAVAYVAICNQHNIPIRVPSEYVECEDGQKNIKVGEKYTVKTPSRQADIVLLVDTSKVNEPVYKDLVQPLVQQLHNDLKAKSIDDINYHLVTYGGENHWPSHVTVGGKIVFTGKAPNLKFAENPKPEKVSTGCNQLDGFIEAVRDVAHDFDLAVGKSLEARTYDEGLQYPFRPAAIKSIIAVTGAPCEVGRFFPVQVLRTLLYRSQLINLNLITYFDEISLKDPKKTKDVVGFNAQTVFTTTQGKGKKTGSELHKELDYSDYCVDFTINNRGNVFVANNVVQAKGGAKKQFVQVTSHSIVEQFVGVEQELECECKFISPFTARSVCDVSSSKEKSTRSKS